MEKLSSSKIISNLVRILIIIIAIFQIINKQYENLGILVITIILTFYDVLLEKLLKIKLDNKLKNSIILFIFGAQCLGSVLDFYGKFLWWDTMLHTINGFLCAAIGFSMIDILNRSPRFHLKMSPLFVALVAFCFSMTIGILWEFFEYGSDKFFKTDMQKDRIISSIASVEINEERKNIPIKINNIEKEVINYYENGELKQRVIEGGHLDIGLKDTMKDLFVNFIGAVVFSIIGLLYIKNRDEYKFAENFIPTMKTKEEKEIHVGDIKKEGI